MIEINAFELTVKFERTHFRDSSEIFNAVRSVGPQHQYASRKLDAKVGALFAEAAGIIVVADVLLLPL